MRMFSSVMPPTSVSVPTKDRTQPRAAHPKKPINLNSREIIEITPKLNMKFESW